MSEIKEKIIEYLYEHGNTREQDIKKAIASQLSCHERSIEYAIKELEKEGKINRIIHKNLYPPAVYLSLEKDIIPLELQKEMIKAEVELRKAEFDYYSKVEQARAKSNPIPSISSLFSIADDLIAFDKASEEEKKKLIEYFKDKKKIR